MLSHHREMRIDRVAVPSAAVAPVALLGTAVASAACLSESSAGNQEMEQQAGAEGMGALVARAAG